MLKSINSVFKTNNLLWIKEVEFKFGMIIVSQKVLHTIAALRYYYQNSNSFLLGDKTNILYKERRWIDVWAKF